MAPRLSLQTKLEEILKSRNVYFQPPPDVKMSYPCIVYKRDNTLVEHANNGPYRYMKRYQVTVIDRNPDSPIPDEIAKMPFCTFSTFFPSDGLNHDVYNLYF